MAHLQQLPELAGLVSDGVNGYPVPQQLLQSYQQHLGPEAFAHLAGLGGPGGGTMEGLPVGGPAGQGAGGGHAAHLQQHLAQMLPHHYKLDGAHQLLPAPQPGARGVASLGSHISPDRFLWPGA